MASTWPLTASIILGDSSRWDVEALTCLSQLGRNVRENPERAMREFRLGDVEVRPEGLKLGMEI